MVILVDGVLSVVLPDPWGVGVWSWIFEPAVPVEIPVVRIRFPPAKFCVEAPTIIEKNANAIYNELLKLGYHAKRIAQNKHGLYPVVYGSFASFTEAQKEMLKIQKSHNPEAWLLIQEL